jgi:predicted ribosomally synthesized peptide with nif11-like leader
MKLQDFFEKAKDNEELKKAFAQAMKDDKVDEFFKDNGIDATKEELVKMAKEAAAKNSELSEEDMEKAAGGAADGSYGWVWDSIRSWGVFCAFSGIAKLGDEQCYLDK